MAYSGMYPELKTRFAQSAQFVVVVVDELSQRVFVLRVFLLLLLFLA